MKHLSVILLTALSLCGASAGNLIWNSGFELGTGNWDSQTVLKKPDHKFSEENGSVLETVTGDVPGGRTALKIRAVNGRRWTHVQSHCFALKPNTGYTVSFFARAEEENTPMEYCVFNYQRELVRRPDGTPLPSDSQKFAAMKIKEFGKKQIMLSKKWKHYSCSFSTSGETRVGTLRFTLKPNVSNAVCIDNVCVTAGNDRGYTPKSQLEALVETSDYLYEKPDRIAGNLRIISYDISRRASVTLFLYDTYWGKVVRSRTISVDLKPGTMEKVPFVFEGELPYGAYCIYTSLQPRTTEAGFARNWEEEPETLAFRRLRRRDESFQSAAEFVLVPTPKKHASDGFRAGTSGGLSNDSINKYWNFYKNFNAAPGVPEERIRIARLSGGNIYRCWDSFVKWAEVEPVRGVFDWSLSDRLLKQAEDAGVEIMCVVGGSFSDLSLHVPEWARKRDLSGNSAGTASEGLIRKWNPNTRFFQPREDDWRNYVRALAAHYKGRIKYYEILNEPGLLMNPETYMRYLKSAAEEIRKADPGAVILGICATEDFGLRIEAFLDRCMELGADRWMDLISIHPYAKLDNSFPNTQMDCRRKLFAYLRKNQYKAGVWNSENYYVVPDWLPRVEMEARVWPEDIARHLIVDLGEGCAGSTPTHLDTLCSCRNQALQVRWTGDVGSAYPDARFVAHAAAMRFIAGAKPEIAMALPGKGLAYSFTNEGKYYTAIWNAIQPDQFYWNVPEGAIVRDVMGNRFKPQEKRLLLNSRPFYVEWPEKTNGAAVRQYLKDNPLSCKTFFQLGQVLLTKENGMERLVFSLKNFSGKSWEKLSLSISSPMFETPGKALCSLSQTGSAELSVPVKRKAGTTRLEKIRITADAIPELLLEAVARPANLTTVGSVPRQFRIEKNAIGKPCSKEDLSAEFSMEFHPREFKMVVNLHVADDRKGTGEKQDYNADSIELFLDRDIFALPAAHYGSKTRQLLFLRKEGTVVKDGVRCTVRDRKDGYDVRLEIPVLNHTFLGFDLAVNDSDGDMRKHQLVWNGSNDNFCNRSRFRVLYCSDACASRVDIKDLRADIAYRYGISDVSAGAAWKKQVCDFLPRQDGTVRVLLLSGYSPKVFFDVEYKNIQIRGGKLLEDTWRFHESARRYSENNQEIIRCSHKAPCHVSVQVRKGIPVTLTYESRIPEQ